MPLTLEQYATYLDSRELPWPAPPEVERPRAKPHLKHLPDVRAVMWNVYGTLLAVAGGDLAFEHPQRFVMSVALDKMVQEFKMWQSMSRKPGAPADYLLQMYSQLLAEQRASSGRIERYPEVLSDRLWETVIKRLMQKDYKFDTGFYGSLNEFSRKVAYFFHSSLQGAACYPGAAAGLTYVADCGLSQGLLADAQCFTTLQLQRAVAAQDPDAELGKLLTEGLTFLSCDVRARKPSERLLRPALEALEARGIAPEEVLHVGSRLQADLIPAGRLQMRTALFAGDRASLQATLEQIKESPVRPDVLLTELGQITQVVGK
jgi:hypothetical protein